MTAAADLILTGGEVHSLAHPDRTFEAVAVRDGRIVRTGRADEVGFLCGVETRVIDLDGRVVLPGFVDAHTHLTTVGRRLVHADLAGAEGPDECVERLRERAAEVASGAVDDGGSEGNGGPDDGCDSDEDADEWVLGFGYDESEWDDPHYLDRGDLDAVSESRPVVAVREDMHVVSLNSVALARCRGEMPAAGVRREGGDPTGVVVEAAAGAVFEAIEPGPGEARDLVVAAARYANERGVTAVHDMVRRSHAPRVYRDLARTGDLTLRVRINYWSDHFDALSEVG
ncbi:MAG: amidohydrolase family protein, partial [Salinigranum sp.]